MPVAKKTKQGNFGTYADLASLLQFVQQEMGLVVRFARNRHEAGPDTVSTYVKPVDASPYIDWTYLGAETPILVGQSRTSLAQADGSAYTYAKRYSLCAALGIATTDDDAQTSGVQTRDPQRMSDDTKKRIDEIMAAQNVPPGYTDQWLTRQVGQRTSYRDLTEPVAQRIIDQNTPATKGETA